MSSQPTTEMANGFVYLVYYSNRGDYESDSPRPVERAYRSIDLAFNSRVAKLGIRPISNKEPYLHDSMNV